MFTWLRNYENKAFCQCCTTVIMGSLTHLKRHETSEKHRNNYKKVQSTPKIQTFLKDDRKLLHQKQVHESELKLVMFLHEHNLPFLIMEHLPKLLKSVCPDSNIAKDIACSRTKATELTNNVLAKESLKSFTSELNKGSNGMFSLIVDETTDTSVKKSLAVVARFCPNGVVKDRFIGLIRVNDASAEAMFNSIVKLLNEIGVPIKNIIGFAGDNAAVMMGRNSGLQALLKKVNENIFILGCTCHSLHLCSSGACKKLPKSVEEFARGLYNHFSNSPKRIEKFEEFQSFLELKPHKMLRPCQTRWLSLQVKWL